MNSRDNSHESLEDRARLFSRWAYNVNVAWFDIAPHACADMNRGHPQADEKLRLIFSLLAVIGICFTYLLANE